ncbi:MAG TPA: DUF6600 domain-containing protein [Telluria sp.]|jgi:hypothetical protein
MSTRFLKTAALMILATACAFAVADDLPTKVGRISLVQGEVGISGELGDETEAALVNWPVTSNNQLSTGRDSRTEVRIGSTALRLDADTSIDVNQLEDETLRITLHYGSLSIRVRNPEVARGLVLDTPEGTVRMQEPGRIRVDAGRIQDTTTIRVFDGVASFDGTGSRLIVRAGKRADIGRDDLRTGVALRDSFDEWGMLRDARDERSESVRYVTSEMTGYEDLDQHGAWTQDSEYGPVWYPRAVATGWVPYRDGRWTYLQPWGWTWVDNAPWGYAPFHYGRWVTVGGRWCWSPGRNVTRAVWSPALVGWVGGNNWNVNFNSGGNRRAAPATGWYPLTPRDTYVPTYRVNHDNLRYLNRNTGELRDDIRGRNRPHNREIGLTVVPHEQFRQRGTVIVPTAPRAIVSTSLLTNVPSAVPPAPQWSGRPREQRADWRGQDRNGDGRPDGRFGRNERNERGQGSVGVQTGTPAPRPSTIISLPSQPPQPQQQGQIQAPRRWGDGPDPLRRENTTHMPTPAPALPPQMQNPPASLGTQRPERFERNERNQQAEPERERRARGSEFWQQQNNQRQQQPQQGLQMTQPQPQPQPQRTYQAPPQQQPQQQQQPQPQPRSQPVMPAPQVQQQQAPQQQAPRQQAPAPAAEKPAPATNARSMGNDEGRRRGMREDSDRR